MPEQKKNEQDCYHDTDNMNDFEKYMAMKWGTPAGLAKVLSSVAFFLLSIGVFLWLLHLANIIK